MCPILEFLVIITLFTKQKNRGGDHGFLLRIQFFWDLALLSWLHAAKSTLSILQNFVYFTKISVIFLFYISIFTNHRYQFVYSTLIFYLNNTFSLFFLNYYSTPPYLKLWQFLEVNWKTSTQKLYYQTLISTQFLVFPSKKSFKFEI